MPEPVTPPKAAQASPAAPATQPDARDAETGTPVPPIADEKIALFAMLAPPQGDGELGRLAQYRVLKILGKGGMGTVLLAEDTQLKRMAALKIMLPQYAGHPQARERFLREARAAARVKHDNVVSIYQVGDEQGIPFIAMDYLKGQPLDRHLSEVGELSLSQVLKIGREIAEGLQAAHTEGLIHRDIKLGNIWLEEKSGQGKVGSGKPEKREQKTDATGQIAVDRLPTAHSPLSTFRVKILDFGLAREEQDDVHLTKSGAVVGTPAYMSPEQAESAAVDHRTDLFSLGVVLYRLCTGKMPFAGTSTIAVLRALALSTPTPIRQLNPSVPAPLETLIERLLEKDLAKRIASAEEVAEALEKIEKSATSGANEVVKEVIYVVPTPAVAAVDPFTNIDATPSSVEPLKAVAKKRPEKAKEVKKKPGGKPLLWVGVGVGALMLAIGVLVALVGNNFNGDGTKKETPPVENNDVAKIIEPPKRAKEVVKNAETPKADPDRKAAEMLHPFFQIGYRLADG